MISNEFNAKLILERFKDNPFLPKFYAEPERYAFPLEMSFLADRYQQLLDDIKQYDLFTDFMIADYDRYKSLIFAQVTLQEEEFGRSYEKDIQISYLDKINAGYLEFIKNQHQLNVKIIDISKLDFVKKREDFLKVLKQIM